MTWSYNWNGNASTRTFLDETQTIFTVNRIIFERRQQTKCPWKLPYSLSHLLFSQAADNKFNLWKILYSVLLICINCIMGMKGRNGVELGHAVRNHCHVAGFHVCHSFVCWTAYNYIVTRHLSTVWSFITDKSQSPLHSHVINTLLKQLHSL